MTDPVERIADSEPTGRAGVSVAGKPLTAALSARLLRVVVDNDAHLPGMFELTFLDLDGSTLPAAGLSIGAQVTITGPGAGGASVTLTAGEVTAIEGLVQGITVRSVVRGYTGAHRLQRAKRSRSFLNVTDADVARRIAGEAGLSVGSVVATSTTHAYLAQVNQTDWEFLGARAAEIGFEMGVADGRFHFRPAGDSLSAAGGGLGGLGRSVLSGLASTGGEVEVRFPENLISFRPRITAGNLTPDVEVRVWDPMTRQAMAQATTTPVGADPSPNSLGRQFTGGALGAVAGSLRSAVDSASSLSATGVVNGLSGAADAIGTEVAQATGGLLGSPVGFLGPPPSNTAHVVVDRPFADGTTMATSGPMVAGALGSDVGSTFAEAEGEAKGNAGIQPGGTISVSGVPSVFAGRWQISRARHIFDDSEFGYRVVFSAHGRQDRTMLGLTSKGARRSSGNPVLDGVVCGVVSDCGDPLGKGRIKVTLPWLAPDFETDWAPNVQFCSGQRSGAMFMPEIGDEVLVAFEFGDSRRPYVIGAMMNNLTQWSIAAGGPIMAGGLPGLGSGVGMLAGQMAGSALGGVAGPAGSVVGGAVGSQVGSAVGNEVANEVTESIAGSALTPGMVSEVHHRGFVSSTGNALLFYDVPSPLTPPSTAEAGQAVGLSLDSGGGTGGAAGSLLPPGAGALGSAIRLGSQAGEIGLTVDQINCGVSIKADPVVGVTANPLANINISSMNGFINIGAGAEGTMMIDGGVNLIIKSTGLITLDAPTVNIIGLPLVNGIPIPL